MAKFNNNFNTSKKFMCDFETTVYDGQESTEVWAAACVEFYKDDVTIFNDINSQLDFFVELQKDVIAYYHNLKFDGAFWVDFLMNNGFKLAQNFENPDNVSSHSWIDYEDMPKNSFKMLISDMGDWYTLTIRTKYGKHIELRDSLKLLPFSVKQIGKAFKTKHQKLDMEYLGFRYAGCEITPEEQEYIKNDVLVVKEALEIMFSQGHNKLTIASCCMCEYKNSIFNKETGMDKNSLTIDIFNKNDFDLFFPDLTNIDINSDVYNASNADEYIRRAYHGGWCYLVKGKENKIYKNGLTADVNSLYPSMMHSESGNYYPLGNPHFWSGNFIPDVAQTNNNFYFVRIKTRFYLKKNKLPFIQIRNSFLYKCTEMLETSDVYDSRTNKYYRYLKDGDELVDTAVTLTLTMMDFQLLKEHYDLEDFEILDGCWFYSNIGIFDDYINKWREIKENSTGALRQIAKLFLNSLYGRFSMSTRSAYKVPVMVDGVVQYFVVPAYDKKAGYIAIGAAITSYSRCFTIRAAQANYYGVDKAGFIYADTDSIHCNLNYDEVKNIKVHNTNFCCWKLESGWDKAIFTRQKTYIEHVVEENKEKIDKPYYSIKCAGMPQKCKDLFEMSMNDNLSDDVVEKLNDEEREFVSVKRTIKDFKIGLKVPSKLLPKRIQGGIILQNTTYEMR